MTGIDHHDLGRSHAAQIGNEVLLQCDEHRHGLIVEVSFGAEIADDEAAIPNFVAGPL
jgi:hypothetical protein